MWAGRGFMIAVLCIAAAGCATVGGHASVEGAHAETPSVVTADYGKTAAGQAVSSYTLSNAHGLTAVVIDYGAILVSLEVPNRKGGLDDIVLGCRDLAGYEKDSPYFGATVGRYANRIARGKFSLDGHEYTLATNNAPNHLHGGLIGFSKVVWEAEPFSNEDGAGVVFQYVSKDMEEGYPGNLHCTVTYTLTNENELKIEYAAETDKATVVNLTHHSYFNLAGHDSGEVLDHILTLKASNYTPTDSTLIPTGKIATVGGTPLDFTHPAAIGAQMNLLAGGYDNNFVLDKQAGELSLAARVEEPGSGRVMEVFTTEPGLQFYSGNFLEGAFTGKDGAKYRKHCGFCLEAQHFPDSPNRPEFPSTVLRPGEQYHQLTVHKFSVK